jgi:hypothetical protein
MHSDDRLFATLFLALVSIVGVGALTLRWVDGRGGTLPPMGSGAVEAAATMSSAGATAGSGTAPERAVGGVVHAVDGGSGVAERSVLGRLVEDLPGLRPGVPAHAEELAPALASALDAMVSGAVPLELARLVDLDGWREVLVREDESGRLVLAAGTRRRYRPVVDLVAALDPGEVAAAWRVVRPAVAAAGGHQTSDEVDLALRQVLDDLLAVDVPDGPVEMEQRTSCYVFAEDDLQRLSPLERHLVLMGPENARRVQRSLEAVRGALGWSEPPAATATDAVLRVASAADETDIELPVRVRDERSGREDDERRSGP